MRMFKDLTQSTKLGTATLLFLCLFLYGTLPTQAVTFTVNSLADTEDADFVADGACDDGNGNCTLREALFEANNNFNGSSERDVIQFDPSLNGEIIITSGLFISEAIYIMGNGPGMTLLDGDFNNNGGGQKQGIGALLTFSSGGQGQGPFKQGGAPTSRIEGLTIQNAVNGAISNGPFASLEVVNCEVVNNQKCCDPGAGIFNDFNAFIRMENCLINDNEVGTSPSKTSPTTIVADKEWMDTPTDDALHYADRKAWLLQKEQEQKEQEANEKAMRRQQRAMGKSGVNPNGGGLYNDGIMIVVNSSINGNTATNNGGGIYNAFSGDLSLANVYVQGNQANNGGGIYNDGDSDSDVDVTSVNVLITGNRAQFLGGGIFNGNESSLELNLTTIASNFGSGLYNEGNVTLGNSIIALNEFNGQTPDKRGGGDCDPDDIFYLSGSITSNDGNLIGNNCTVEGDFGTPPPTKVAPDVVGTPEAPIDPEFLAPITPSTQPSTSGDYRMFPISPAAAIGELPLPADAFDVDEDDDTGEDLPIDLAGDNRLNPDGTLAAGAFRVGGCIAIAGNLGAGTNFCSADAGLSSYTPTVDYGAGMANDPATYSYTYLVTGADGSTIISGGDAPLDLSTLGETSYLVCGLSYLTAEAANLPLTDGTATLADVEASIMAGFCADVTDNCDVVSILNPTVVSQSPADDPVVLTDGDEQCFSIELEGTIRQGFSDMMANFNDHYIDISGTGTALGGGDDNSYPFTLPFSFSFGSFSGTDLFVSTNVFINDTGNGSFPAGGCPLENSNPGRNEILVFGDDMVVNDQIYQQDFAAAAVGHPGHPLLGTTIAVTVLQWNDIVPFGGSGNFIIQALLYENGDLLFLYDPDGTATDNGSSAQIGSVNNDGSISSTYSCNEAISAGTNGILQELAVFASSNYQITWTGPDGTALPPSLSVEECFTFDLADPCVAEMQTVSYVVECLDNTGAVVPNSEMTGSFNIEVFPPNCSPSILQNPSFETGDFTGWIVDDVTAPFVPIDVVTDGASPGFGFFTSQATAGTFSAAHGFDGAGPDSIVICQDISLPSSVGLLTFDYRAAWDYTFGNPTIDRTLVVDIQPTGGGGSLSSELIFTAPISEPTNLDTGPLSASVDLSPFASQDIRLCIIAIIPESFEGPGYMTYDNFQIFAPISISNTTATNDFLCCQDNTTVSSMVNGIEAGSCYQLAYALSPVSDGLIIDESTFSQFAIDTTFATPAGEYTFTNDCSLPEGDYYITPLLALTDANGAVLVSDANCVAYGEPVIITIEYCCPVQADVIEANGNNSNLCTDLDNGNAATLPEVIVTGTSSENATYTWTQTAGAVVTVAAGPTPTVTFSPNTACTPEVYTFALTVGCVLDPALALDGGTVSYTLYPDINSQDNMIVGNGTCCPSIDLECPTEYAVSSNLGGTRNPGQADCSALETQGAFSYFVTLINPPTDLFQAGCLEQFYPVQYDCRACPTVTTAVAWSETLCEGGQMNLNGAAATVEFTNVSGFAAGISFWLDAAFTQAAPSIPVYTGTGCEAQNLTIYAALGCDRSGDGQPEEFVPAGDFPLTLYPQPIAPQINQTNIDEANGQCSYEVIPACPDDNLDVTTFGPLATPSGGSTTPIQVTSGIAGTLCPPQTFEVAYAPCSICDFDMTVEILSQGDNGGVTPFFQNHAQITIVGGLLPYDLSWERNGLVRYRTSATTNPDGLVVDIFYADQSFWSVTATDATGVCEQTQSSNLGSSDLLNITSSTITGATDQSINDGSIAITVAGGTPPYNYAWTGPLGYSELVTGDATGSNLMTGLHYGWYNVVVSDDDGDSTFGWFWVAPDQNNTGGFIRGKVGALTQAVLQAQPNPFAIQTELFFALPMAVDYAEVTVYGLNGQKVATLYSDAMEGQTPYTVNFNAEQLPTGIYVVQLITNTGEQVQEKVVLVR